ncbi:hypothetical protein [Pseudogemmobacter bohemicus]|uniref:hypothetical protein n=1 Tax=Pseudogemmobacter bohemicus TaxID=2250708 RepID=UPI000DD39347|nr:hypothetical protein [Pseudogemmobacter bohemicus]
MDTMIELPTMRRSAELAPNTADAGARTVEVIWSAGTRVRRASFRTSFPGQGISFALKPPSKSRML